MLLSLRKISVSLKSRGQKEKFLVKDVDFDVPENTIVALVGGSGSGKTTTGLSVLKLLPLGLDLKGDGIFLNGENLLTADEGRMRSLRGKKISMVFQEPLNAFNPVYSIGYQIEEVLRYHSDLPSARTPKRVLELLDLVEVPDPKRVARSYPHQLSGGLRQRAMIAQAIAGNPQIIIADEPTSNLDVTLQARVMDLFRKLKNEFHVSMLLITHDLGMVEHMADEVVVMNQGKIVEKGKVENVLASSQNAYTTALRDAAHL